MVGRLNLAFLTLALLLALLCGVRWDARSAVVTGPQGNNAIQTVVDARGVSVPVARYRRIVSASTLADGVLLELVEPERVLAVSLVSAKSSHKFSNLVAIAALDDLERILSLKPDLVIVSSPGTFSKVERLREAGLLVFDLGPMTGVDKFLKDVEVLGTLLSEPARARAYVRTYRARLERVALDISPRERKSAMYLSTYGGKLLGGGQGTSYHDVLLYAGLKDRVAGLYKGFLEFTPEQVLELDPELVVTASGMPQRICARPGLYRLHSCRLLAADRENSGFVELPEDLLSDPGARMLEAAEAIRSQAYP